MQNRKNIFVQGAYSGFILATQFVRAQEAEPENKYKYRYTRNPNINVQTLK